MLLALATETDHPQLLTMMIFHFVRDANWVFFQTFLMFELINSKT
jgi:hypothetical protein